jgi:hypothetical protein
MPFSMLVYIFEKDSLIRRIGKMYATSKPSNEILVILFFTRWDRRVHNQSGEEIEANWVMTCFLSSKSLQYSLFLILSCFFNFMG